MEMAERRLAEVKASLSFELVPPQEIPRLWGGMPAAEDNSVPLYEQAFERIDFLYGSAEDLDAEYEERIEAIRGDAGLSDVEKARRVAALEAEKAGRRDLLKEFQQIQLMYGRVDPEELAYYDEERDEYVEPKRPAKDPARAQRFFKVPAVAEALALRGQAVLRPRFYEDYDWSKHVEVLLPNLSKMRRLTMLTDLEAEVAGEAGRAADAYAAVAKMLRMSRHLEQEPLLVNVLVSMANRQIAVHRLATLLPAGAPPKDAAADLSVLLTHDAGKLLAAAVATEAVTISPLYDDLASGRVDPLRWSDPSDGRNRTPSFSQYVLAANAPVIMMAKAEYLRLMDRYARAAALPPKETLAEFAAIDERVVAMKTNALTPMPNIGMMLLAIFMPAFNRVAEVVYRDDVQSRMARVAIQVAAFRAARGTLPVALAGLPDADRLPKDPFADKPFLYRVEADGFALWSVGPDGDDDGGRTNDELQRVLDEVRENDGDIVLRVPPVEDADDEAADDEDDEAPAEAPPMM